MRLLRSAASAGVVDDFLDSFQGFACAFLNPAIKDIVLAFDELEVIVRQVRPFFLQFAFDDVPVAFNFEGIHNN